MKSKEHQRISSEDSAYNSSSQLSYSMLTNRVPDHSAEDYNLLSPSSNWPVPAISESPPNRVKKFEQPSYSNSLPNDNDELHKLFQPSHPITEHLENFQISRVNLPNISPRVSSSNSVKTSIDNGTALNSYIPNYESVSYRQFIANNTLPSKSFYPPFSSMGEQSGVDQKPVTINHRSVNSDHRFGPINHRTGTIDHRTNARELLNDSLEQKRGLLEAANMSFRPDDNPYNPRGSGSFNYHKQHNDEDDDSSSCSDFSGDEEHNEVPIPVPELPVVVPKKRGPGRPPKPESERKKRKSSHGRLWEFIRNLLLNPETCPSIVRWEDPEVGIFRFVQSEKVAEIWGSRKANGKMNYEKLSRAMRYYYKGKVFEPVIGRRLVYKFGPKATGWKPNQGNFDR